MVVDKIKYLCDLHCMSIRELELATGIGNGIIARWKTSSPKIDNLQKVADYFDVSIDYLLDRENSLPVSKEIMDLAERIHALPPEAKEVILQQIKLYDQINKKS